MWEPRVQLPGGVPGGTQQLLDAVDIGAAYLPHNQDPTLGTSTIPGAAAYTTTFNNPASMALQNNQYNADGSLKARLLPKSAGFGAATGAQNYA